jgi:thioredoxin reductase
MADREVEVVRGEASFAGPNAIGIGDRIIEARHIVIATGSKPRSLPIAGAEHIITSGDVLSEREQPREVVFIGGGIIALELGPPAASPISITSIWRPGAFATAADASKRMIIFARRPIRLYRSPAVHPRQ